MEANHQAGHVCWDGLDTMNGKPTGAIRVSFGFASRPQDADQIFEFLERYFLEDEPCARGRLERCVSGSQDLEVEAIALYPIKACHGMTVSSWPLGKWDGRLCRWLSDVPQQRLCVCSLTLLYHSKFNTPSILAATRLQRTLV